MRFARSLLIFSYGLFTIAAQTLLFREFLTAFEGNDISVGIFFGSWLLWVGLGAMLVYKNTRIAEKLSRHTEFLFLCYLPAFALQLALIIQARRLAGIEAYALWSIRDILFLSVIVNAPVSIITGMLFPTACRWLQQDTGTAVSNVYIIEALGSFLGGLGTTVLLALGVSPAKIFLILAFIISLSVSAVQLAKLFTEHKSIKGCVFSILILLCALYCLAIGADKTLMHHVQTVKWTKLLPQDAFAGSFQTAQAEYLYGVYHNQWVILSQGGTIEAIPDQATAGRIAAIGLCQDPAAKRILVVGSGLGLCQTLLKLPQVEHITWAHPDSEYVREVNNVIPAQFKITDKRLDCLAGDIRSLLADKKQYYDIAVINLPDATSSVLNRYYTLEFYRQIKDSLNPAGLLQVRVTGGENIMGTELINLGASVKLTLQKVFQKLVLTPGDDTWFIASDSNSLTGDPGILRDRFAAIKNSGNIFVPDALLSVYLPDRAAIALDNYNSSDLPQRLLINRDSRPLTNLYSLLLTAKQSGAPTTKLIKNLSLAGPPVLIIPIVVLVLLRLIYILKSPKQDGKSGFDSSFLVFSTGWAGIGTAIVLMYLYQTCFGSLYLHIGVISSLFMAGLAVGGALIKHLLVKNSTRLSALLCSCILIQIAILGAIAFWPSSQWTHLLFAAAFVLYGLCTGGYFPIAAAQLSDAGIETGPAGSKLETADHIGASAGGLLTGLVLVPVLGTKSTLLIFILLVLANLPPAVIKIYNPQRLYAVAPLLRRFGYILFGMGVSIVISSNLLVAAAAKLSPSLPVYVAQTLAGQLRIEQTSTPIKDRSLNYFKVSQPDGKPAGFIFSSQDLSPDVTGFGGKINLAIYIDPAGKLLNFRIIRSNETPAYLELLSRWLPTLNGRQLFQPQPFANVHAVTGATVSSKAVLAILQTSSHKFAEQALGQTLQTVPAAKIQKPKYMPDANAIYLITALIFTLLVIFFGGFWSRLAFLAFNLIIGGLLFNTQYSTEQIATILSLHSPAAGLSAAFLLVVGAPLLAVLFGNIYCGYLCPFGAAQELLSYIVPARFKHQPSIEKMQKARFVKYVVLFILIIAFFISRDRTTLTPDLLISIFNLKSTILLIAAIAILGSLFYGRFWCRYLCPAGAFLSLFNALALLKRYFPAKRYARCEFGLTAGDRLDCIYCDRCRYQKKPLAEPAPQSTVLTWAVIAAIFVSAVSVNIFLQTIPSGIEQPAASAISGGQPRNVDLKLIRTMIDQKRLSEKEAKFYKKLEPSPPKVTDKPEDKRQDK
jgi:spermidine synthase